MAPASVARHRRHASSCLEEASGSASAPTSEEASPSAWKPSSRQPWPVSSATAHHVKRQRRNCRQQHDREAHPTGRRRPAPKPAHARRERGGDQAEGDTLSHGAAIAFKIAMPFGALNVPSLPSPSSSRRLSSSWPKRCASKRFRLHGSVRGRRRRLATDRLAAFFRQSTHRLRVPRPTIPYPPSASGVPAAANSSSGESAPASSSRARRKGASWAAWRSKRPRSPQAWWATSPAMRRSR